MWIIILYIGITVVGYLLAPWLAKAGFRFEYMGRIQTCAIMALVFCMGSRIGSNEEIVRSLDTIGLIAFVITVFSMAGGVVSVFLVRNALGFNRYGVRHGETVRAAEIAEANKKGGVNRLTIIIVIAVAVGIASGYFFLPDGFINIAGNLISVFLCLLLLTVGIDMGKEGTIVQSFRTAGWRILMIPFAVMAGTLAGGLVVCLFMPIGIHDCLCVSGGFAWYSLAPAMLMDYSVKVSAISFMHNVMRELFGILTIPIVARKIGYMEAISLPASCAMDVCLPIIVRATSPDTAVTSFISGVIVSASVPVVVSILIAI